MCVAVGWAVGGCVWVCVLGVCVGGVCVGCARDARGCGSLGGRCRVRCDLRREAGTGAEAGMGASGVDCVGLCGEGVCEVRGVVRVVVAVYRCGCIDECHLFSPPGILS